MKRGLPFPELASNPPGPERDMDITYNLSFRWGQLQVTTEADDAYRLVPLTADKIDGPSRDIYSKGDRGNPSLNVILVPPGEIPTSRSTSEDIGSGSKVAFSERRIDLLVGFTETVDEVREANIQEMKDEVAPKLTHEPTDADLPKGPFGEPVDESMRHHIPQTYAHMLAEIVLEKGAEAYVHYDERARQNDSYRDIRNRAIEGMTVAAGSVGLASFVENELSVVGTAVGFGLAAITAHNMVIRLREDTRRGPVDTSVSEITAIARAQEASGDIYQAYSSTHFEERFRDGPDVAE